MPDTLLVAGNPGDKPTTTALTLVYNGGKGCYTMEKLLQPGQQIWADVGSIIGNQTPDKDGHMISQAVTAGSYEVRDVDNPIRGKVYEGKLILDKTYGHAAYGCGVCCGYDWVAFDPSSYSGSVGNSTADHLLAGNSCYAEYDDVTYGGYDWGSSITAVATVVGGAYTTLVGAGTASGSAYATLPGTNIRQGCPDTGFLATPQSITAYAVHVTNVNLSSDQVQVTLQGPSGNTGTLVVSWNGPGGNPDIANESVGPGSYTFNPPLDSSHLAPGQYTGVKAAWHSVSSSYSKSFDVLGVYKHTQYNTPAESQCSGSTATAYLTTGPTSCPWSTVSLIQQFISQAWENGSGITKSYGRCQEYLAGCAMPSGGDQNYFREVASVSPSCGGSLNDATVAADLYTANHPLSCGDQILIVGFPSGSVGTVKTVTDGCPACKGAAQLDDYTTSNACANIPGLGNLQTIRINR